MARGRGAGAVNTSCSTATLVKEGKRHLYFRFRQLVVVKLVERSALVIELVDDARLWAAADAVVLCDVEGEPNGVVRVGRD